jgi:two-component system sporulation sensor kinase A
MATVLLVDDEPNIRWTMSEILKRQGHEALTASDFDSADAILRNANVDVAVIDVILPGKNGVDLLKALRRRDQNIPVLMMTGQPEVSLIPDILRAGPCDFMPKPVLKEDLISGVARALETRQLMQEKQRLEEATKNHTVRLEGLVQERTGELAEAHNFLNLVLDASTEYAIVACDARGRFNLFNRGAELIFGCSQEEVLGSSVRDQFVKWGGDPSSFEDWAREASAAGHHRADGKLYRADGSIFYGVVTTTVIRGHDCEVIGYLGIIKDQTARRRSDEAFKNIQERLATTERIAALGRVAAQVAHEVKNPLAGLKLYALHLKSKIELGLAPSETSLVDKIVDTIDHLSETVERVLDFAHPIGQARRTVDLNQLVDDAIHMLESQIRANNIVLKTDLCQTGTVGLLDEPSIRSALLNLILNAIQSMPGGGDLGITTFRQDGWIQLMVDDTGCGIDEDRLETVFEPFNSTKSRGLGLGLPYSKKVIDEHGGQISVESQKNRGTRVEVMLPAEK